nr:DUF2461 family protein [Pseudopedobacter sp.]
MNLNNSKEWLDSKIKEYENTKNDILTLTAELITALSDFDQTISNGYLDPKSASQD